MRAFGGEYLVRYFPTEVAARELTTSEKERAFPRDHHESEGVFSAHK